MSYKIIETCARKLIKSLLNIKIYWCVQDNYFYMLIHNRAIK